MIESQHIPLVLSWLQGTLTPNEKERLQELLDDGTLDILDLKELEITLQRMDRLEAPEPSPEMTGRFYEMLAQEKMELSRTVSDRLREWISALMTRLTPLRVGLAAGVLLLGILIGNWATPLRNYQGDIDTLQREITRMREVMMLSLIDNSSATERLRAVNISGEIREPEPRVKEALIRTLNNDPNINVRIAAVDALLRRAADPEVRSALVSSISRQESPLVQAALADAMLILQEEGSIEALRELLRQEEIDSTLRNKIEDTITKLS